MSLEAKHGLGEIGEFPLVPGEDPVKYRSLYNDIRSAINPKDIFEQIWVADLTNQIWETNRYRRLMAKFVASGEQVGLERILRRLIHGSDGLTPISETILKDASFLNKSQALALEHAQGKKQASEEIRQILRNAGRDWSEVTTEAFAVRASEIQRVAQLLAKAESRRNATLKAVERHRTGLGPLLQQVADQFDAAASQDIANKATAPKLVA
jgi:hypothetical protein